jgi:hypothetical protein
MTCPSLITAVACPSKIRAATALAAISRLTAVLTATRVTAPITPPISDESLPMIAFWTALDSRKITTKSNVFMFASPRLPLSRNSTAISA